MYRHLPALALLLAFTLPGRAFAQDSDPSVADGAAQQAEDDEFDFLNAPAASAQKDKVSGDSFSLYEDGDDADLADFQLAPKPEPKPKAAPRPAVPEGAAPLTPSYKAEIVAAASDSVVVELPVLVARTPGDVAQDFWLVGEVWVQGKKVGETRQFISAQGLSQLGPTTAFLKVQAPVGGPQGQVELRVFKVVGGGKPEALFTQAVDYSL